MFGKKKKKSKQDDSSTELSSEHACKNVSENGSTVLRVTEATELEAWVVRGIPVWKPGDIILENYRVEDIITSGGMGRIYVTEHQDWKVKVAIKSPTEEMLNNRDYFSRVQKEAEAWTELGLHPNIAYCFFVRNIKEVPHLFVEYIDGGNLRHWIKYGKCVDLRIALDLAIQFCHGVAHAHDKGLIHRDIKPENILMTKDGTLKITDFGIAKVEAGGDLSKDRMLLNIDETKTYGFIGTMAYASPEQWREAHNVGPETDIFSFGICLWEMLCGRRPYNSIVEKQEIPDPRILNPDLPEIICNLLEKLVAFEGEDRQNLGGFHGLKEQFKSVYRELFNEPSPHSELEKVDLKADGLNNRGVSYLEFGKSSEAAACFKEVLDIFPHHMEAVYNNELLSWRQGLKTDIEAIAGFDSLKDIVDDKARYSFLLEQLHKEQQGYSLSEVDFSETFAFVKEFLAFHVKTRRILVRTSDRNLFVVGIGAPSLEIKKNISEHVRHAAFSMDGKSFVLIGSDSVNVWSIEKNESIKSVSMLDYWGLTAGPVLCTDGTILFAKTGMSEERPSVYCCLPDSSEFLRLCIEPGSDIVSLDIDYDDRRILTASRDGACRMWSMDGFGECFHYNQRGMTYASFNQSRDMHITCSSDGVTTLWRGANTKYKEILTHPDYAIAASLSTDNSLLATLNTKWKEGGWDIGRIHIWEIPSGRCLNTITDVNCDYDSRIEFSDEGTMLFAFSGKAGLRAWRLERKHPKAQYEFCRPQTVYEVTSADKKAERYILEAQESLRNGNATQAYRSMRSAQEDANYTYDPRIIKILQTLHERGSKKGIHNFRALHTMEAAQKAPVTVLSFLDETHTLSGTKYGSLQVWNLTSSECEGELRGHTDSIRKIVHAASSRVVATLDEKKHMRVWDISNKECLAYFDYSKYEEMFHHLTISPDGKRAFSTNGKDHAVLWDIEINEIDDHFKLSLNKGISGALFSAKDNNSVLLKLEDASWLRLDLSSKKCELVENSFQSCDAYESQHIKASILNNAFVLSSNMTGEELITIRGHNESILSFDISADERNVISGDEGGVIRLWELDWELDFD